MTNAKLGYGCELKMGGTLIDECYEMGPIGEDFELKEATHHQSPSSRREYIAGLADGRTMSFMCNNTGSAAQAAVRAAAGTEQPFTYMIPEDAGNETNAFNAIIVMWEKNPQLDDKQIFGFDLKITGAITES